MDFLDLDLKRSYKSLGDHTITEAFLIPALKRTKKYKRSVGFFSSSVLSTILDGVVSLVRRNGSIQLIASPKLSQEDIEAINLGYAKRDEIVSVAFARDFVPALGTLDDQNLDLLVTLISRSILDIKIVVTKSCGIYHDKLGILEDEEGNTIVFFGSSNSTASGYEYNYEKIRVFRSWAEGERQIVLDEVSEFDSLWSGTNDMVDVYDYRESAQAQILEVLENRKHEPSETSEPIKLRDYQNQAIQAWKENGYKGFYVMATGTGKTWTAIYSAKTLLEEHPATVVICAPYKHLVKQWYEDVHAAFPEAVIIMVSSENPGWSKQITEAIIKKRYNPLTQLIIISTIASFNMQRFSEVIHKDSGEKLLIVDEAHRFTNRAEDLHKVYSYLLGLSATPYSGTSAAKGRELMAFFGNQVFSLTIEDALERKYLVPYYYHPIFVDTTSEEEDLFQYYTKRIAGCFDNRGRCINPDLLVKSLRSRLRVISMAAEKMSKIDEIIDHVPERDHLVVYCGDGHLFDGDNGREIRHIQAIKKVLYEHDYKSSQFTATENMETRMALVDAFNKGEISALAAIRCLDEGINIPSIKSALILSSNDDYREFVQRRGRILRTYKGKKCASIYDVIVLPSTECPGIAKIEFRRFREYAKLALNWDDLQPILSEYLESYSISEEEIDVYDYEGMEETIDE